MKKLSLAILTSFIFSAVPVFSLETGVLIDSYASAWSNDVSKIEKAEDVEVEAKETLSLNAKQPFNKNGSQYLSLEGNVQYKYTNNAAGIDDDKVFADLTLFKYTGAFNFLGGKNVFNIGRFSVSDFTGLIFSQPSDGAMFQYLSNKFQASIYGGYTGFLNAQTSTMLPSNESDFEYDQDSVYDFQDSYAVGSILFSFPYLLLNQTVSLEGIALLGTKGINSDNSEKYRVYGTFALNGPLASNLFYTVHTTFATENEQDMMNLSAVYLDFYPNFKDMDFGLNFVYATPQKDNKSAFKGITSQTAVFSYDEPQYSSMMKGGGSISIKPVEKILAKVGGDAVFAYLDEENKVSPSGNLGYHGFQVYANLICQIFTDMKANLFFSDFIGNESEYNKLFGSFSLTIAL